MPRKSDPPEQTVETPVLETFFFPTVGNGVSIQAASLEEAQEKIKKHPLYKA